MSADFTPEHVFKVLSGAGDTEALGMDADGLYRLDVTAFLGGRGVFEVVDTVTDRVEERFLVMIQKDPSFTKEEKA
jgi:hypothetical protein